MYRGEELDFAGSWPTENEGSTYQVSEVEVLSEMRSRFFGILNAVY